MNRSILFNLAHELVKHVVYVVRSCRAYQLDKHLEISVEVFVLHDPRHHSTLRQGLIIEVRLEGDTVADHVLFEPFCLAVVEENHKRHKDQSGCVAGCGRLLNTIPKETGFQGFARDQRRHLKACVLQGYLQMTPLLLLRPRSASTRPFESSPAHDLSWRSPLCLALFYCLMSTISVLDTSF